MRTGSKLLHICLVAMASQALVCPAKRVLEASHLVPALVSLSPISIFVIVAHST